MMAACTSYEELQHYNDDIRYWLPCVFVLLLATVAVAAVAVIALETTEELLTQELTEESSKLYTCIPELSGPY